MRTATRPSGLVAAARTAADLFGDGRAGPGATASWSRLVHPDRLAADPAVRADALDAFVARSPPGGRPGRSPSAATTGSARSPHRGDLADLYDVGDDRLLKLPRRPGRQRPDGRARHTPCARIAERRRPALPAVRAPARRELPAPRRRDRRRAADQRARHRARLHDLAEVRARVPRRARPARRGLDVAAAAGRARLGAPGRRGARRGPARARADRARPSTAWCWSTGAISAPAGAARSRRWSPGHDDWYPPEVRREAAARPRHRHLHGHPLHDLADGRPRARARCGLRRRLPLRAAGRPARRRLAAARANSTSCWTGCTGHAPSDPSPSPPKESCHGKRNLVHRRLRRRRPTTARPPARAPSPTATAAPAPCTPRSTRAASARGRAATPTSTRESTPDRRALRRDRLDGQRAARPADQAAAAARPAACARGTPSDPQIMFGAIGDATCDRVPLQVGQFESDNRMDDDLGRIVLEGGGGGQMTESYELAMYFMARHTATRLLRQARPARLPVHHRRRAGVPAGQAARRSAGVIGDELREDDRRCGRSSPS